MQPSSRWQSASSSGALQVLGNADYLKRFSADQLRTEALVRINGFHDMWSINIVVLQQGTEVKPVLLSAAPEGARAASTQYG
jgi:hypothetical protein